MQITEIKENTIFLDNGEKIIFQKFGKEIIGTETPLDFKKRCSLYRELRDSFKRGEDLSKFVGEKFVFDENNN